MVSELEQLEQSICVELDGLLSQSERPRWAIARLLARAERDLGDQVGAVYELAGVRGMSLATIRRRVWVANTWDEGHVASFPTLSFSHFEAVTAKWLDQADAIDLLADAVAEGMTVDVLRANVKALREPGEPEAPLRLPDVAAPLPDFLASVLYHEHGVKLKQALDLGQAMAAGATTWFREEGLRNG